MEDLFLSETFWQFVKYPVVLLMILYLIFAVVVVKQTQLMTKTLEVSMEKIVLTFSYIHLVSAIGVLFLTIIFL